MMLCRLNRLIFFMHVLPFRKASHPPQSDQGCSRRICPQPRENQVGHGTDRSVRGASEVGKGKHSLLLELPYRDLYYFPAWRNIKTSSTTHAVPYLFSFRGRKANEVSNIIVPNLVHHWVLRFLLGRAARLWDVLVMYNLPVILTLRMAWGVRQHHFPHLALHLQAGIPGRSCSIYLRLPIVFPCPFQSALRFVTEHVCRICTWVFLAEHQQ